MLRTGLLDIVKKAIREYVKTLFPPFTKDRSAEIIQGTRASTIVIASALLQLAVRRAVDVGVGAEEVSSNIDQGMQIADEMHADLVAKKILPDDTPDADIKAEAIARAKALRAAADKALADAGVTEEKEEKKAAPAPPPPSLIPPALLMALAGATGLPTEIIAKIEEERLEKMAEVTGRTVEELRSLADGPDSGPLGDGDGSNCPCVVCRARRALHRRHEREGPKVFVAPPKTDLPQ